MNKQYLLMGMWAKASTLNRLYLFLNCVLFAFQLESLSCHKYGAVVVGAAVRHIVVFVVAVNGHVWR